LAVTVDTLMASSAPGSAVSVSTASSLRGGGDTCAKIKGGSCPNGSPDKCGSKTIWENGSGTDEQRCLTFKSWCGDGSGGCTEYFSGGGSCAS
jgi:hypothetical protein